MYSSTPSLTSDLDGVNGLRDASATLPPGKTRSEVKEGVELYIHFPLGLLGLF
jgi:hypothetical protein